MTYDEKQTVLDNLESEAWERIRCTDSSLFNHREVWEQAIEVVERCQRIRASLKAEQDLHWKLNPDGAWQLV